MLASLCRIRQMMLHPQSTGRFLVRSQIARFWYFWISRSFLIVHANVTLTKCDQTPLHQQLVPGLLAPSTPNQNSQCLWAGALAIPHISALSHAVAAVAINWQFFDWVALTSILCIYNRNTSAVFAIAWSKGYLATFLKVTAVSSFSAYWCLQGGFTISKLKIAGAAHAASSLMICANSLSTAFSTHKTSSSIANHTQNKKCRNPSSRIWSRFVFFRWKFNSLRADGIGVDKTISLPKASILSLACIKCLVTCEKRSFESDEFSLNGCTANAKTNVTAQRI